jgi:hypothetical protein
MSNLRRLALASRLKCTYYRPAIPLRLSQISGTKCPKIRSEITPLVGQGLSRESQWLGCSKRAVLATKTKPNSSQGPESRHLPNVTDGHTRGSSHERASGKALGQTFRIGTGHDAA